MPSYDARNYDPPAPIASVTLRAANGTTVPDIQLLIDTGADTTLLPRSAIVASASNPTPHFNMNWSDSMEVEARLRLSIWT